MGSSSFDDYSSPAREMCMEIGGGGRGRRGGRTDGGKTTKQKQPQRGLGVAQLEKIRLHNQMLAAYRSAAAQQLHDDDANTTAMTMHQLVPPPPPPAAAVASSFQPHHHLTVRSVRLPIIPAGCWRWNAAAAAALLALVSNVRARASRTSSSHQMFPSLVLFPEPLFRGDGPPPPPPGRRALLRRPPAVQQYTDEPAGADAVSVRARRQGLVGTQAGAAAAAATATLLDDEQQERRGQRRGARFGAQVVAGT